MTRANALPMAHPTPEAALSAVNRRRIYLMRHGSVDYFTPQGKPVRPDRVPLNAIGCVQADAAGALFAASNVRFDRVVSSGLTRTNQTAQRVLHACGQGHLEVQVEPALQEIRSGRLDALNPPDLMEAFLRAFSDGDESTKFLGGETVGSLLDRVLPTFDALLRDPHWACMLLVLHGAVNRVILNRALTGRRGLLGAIEQHPACINILDVGLQHPLQPHDDAPHFVVRGINLSPTQWLHAQERHTTMEHLLLQYLRPASAPTQADLADQPDGVAAGTRP